MTGASKSAPSGQKAAAVFADLPFRNLIDPRAAHECALALQDRVDASAFALDGINFWMLVRQFLFMQSARQANVVFSSLFGAPSVSGRVFEGSDFGTEKVLRQVEVLPLRQSSVIASRTIDLTAAKGCLLFVEVPGDYTQYLGEHAVNAHLDPVLRHFRAKGHKVEKFCRYQRRLVAKPKLEPPHYFTLAAAGQAARGPKARQILQGVEAVNRALAGFRTAPPAGCRGAAAGYRDCALRQKLRPRMACLDPA